MPKRTQRVDSILPWVAIEFEECCEDSNPAENNAGENETQSPNTASSEERWESSSPTLQTVRNEIQSKAMVT